MIEKTTTDKPPECWVEKQPIKSKEKLYGIWAKYNKVIKSRIEKECGQQEKKRKGVKKKRKGK